LLHIRDAEQWWYENWTRDEPVTFEKLPTTISIGELITLFNETTDRRRSLLAGLCADDLLREVVAEARPGLRLRFRMGESMLQLSTHGTHHRAQAVNMLRRLGAAVPELDLAAWLCQGTEAHV
jgi:uncharacterized damage-inducible protein DinB